MNHQTDDPYASRLDLQMWGVWDGGGWYSVIYHKCNYSSISTPLLQRRFNLTHWGRVTHICGGKLTTIGSDNGLSPGRRQAIIWTNDGILLFRTLGTNFSEILSKIHSFSFKKTHLKLSSAKGRLSRLGLNELTTVKVRERMDNCIPTFHLSIPEFWYWFS